MNEEKDIEKISAILELSEEDIREIGRAKERREKASYSGSVSFEMSKIFHHSLNGG